MQIEQEIIKINDFNKKINDQMTDFINRCYSLEELSNNEYKVQKTIELNKIYFQGYVLDSNLCQKFKENNLLYYSLEDLKKYISKNYYNLDGDYASYYEALSLYEEACNIENIVDEKIEEEIDFLKKYYEKIEILKEKVLDKEKLIKIYQDIRNNLLGKFSLKENHGDYYISILDDIFNYFWSGYPLIIND